MRLPSWRTLATGSIAVCVTLGAGAVALRPRPTQLSISAGAEHDTVVINKTRATRLSVSVVDQYGRRLKSDTAVRFRLISGKSIELSATGETTCTRNGDAVVQANFLRLTKAFVLHCRPVASLEAPSWMDFVVGDSVRDLSFVARGPDGRMVTELRGNVTMTNASVAELRGTTVRPKRPGRAMAIVEIGDASARISVQVYQPVTSFVDNPSREGLSAMRVRLGRGDTIVVPLPKAAFWVKYFSPERGVAPPTIELRGNGSCTTGDGVRVQRVEEDEYAKYCLTGDGDSIMIAHGATGAKVVTGAVALQLVWR